MSSDPASPPALAAPSLCTCAQPPPDPTPRDGTYCDGCKYCRAGYRFKLSVTKTVDCKDCKLPQPKLSWLCEYCYNNHGQRPSNSERGNQMAWCSLAGGHEAPHYDFVVPNTNREIRHACNEHRPAYLDNVPGRPASFIVLDNEGEDEEENGEGEDEDEHGEGEDEGDGENGDGEDETV